MSVDNGLIVVTFLNIKGVNTCKSFLPCNIWSIDHEIIQTSDSVQLPTHYFSLPFSQLLPRRLFRRFCLYCIDAAMSDGKQVGFHYHGNGEKITGLQYHGETQLSWKLAGFQYNKKKLCHHSRLVFHYNLVSFSVSSIQPIMERNSVTVLLRAVSLYQGHHPGMPRQNGDFLGKEAMARVAATRKLWHAHLNTTRHIARSSWALCSTILMDMWYYTCIQNADINVPQKTENTDDRITLTLTYWDFFQIKREYNFRIRAELTHKSFSSA